MTLLHNKWDDMAAQPVGTRHVSSHANIDELVRLVRLASSPRHSFICQADKMDRLIKAGINAGWHAC